VIRAIRALLLICCLSAVVAAAMFARTFNSLEAAERARLPVVSATIVEDVNGVKDPVTLKALCVDLAKGVKAESMEREARYRSFLSLARQVAKWGLGLQCRLCCRAACSLAYSGKSSHGAAQINHARMTADRSC